MKRYFILLIMFFIMISTSFAFSDSGNYAWANDAINKWSLGGYVSGYPDGTFRGNNNITRAEVIAVINKINNLDVTVICQKPKIAEYTLKMRQNLSEVFKCDLSQISIKGTTTEKLGFTGREEGIAAMAVILLEI